MAAGGGAGAAAAAEGAPGGAGGAPGGAAGGPAGPVSFAFSRRAERRRPLPAGPCAEPGAGPDSDTDTELLTAVEDRELLGTRPAPPPPKELVIPLIPPNRWRNPEPPRAQTGPAPTADGHAPSSNHAPKADPAPSTDPAPSGDPPDPPSVEAQAVQELLQEARQSREQPQEGSGPPIAIPLQLPDRDVATGPQPTPQDYEAVPVGQFGLAMLRGMGWSHGQGIGRTFPRVVTPLEHRPRPRGLGLGAEGAPPGTPKPGEPPQGGLAVGDPVSIEAGPHRGVEGKVEGLDPETGRALVRLKLGGQVVAVNQHGLRPVSTGAQKGPEGGAQFGDPQRGGEKRKEPPKPERPVKHFRGDPPGTPIGCGGTCGCAAWTGPSTGGATTTARGHYYNCKLQVEDLLAPDTCVCRTDDGRLVEGLHEASLETVVPRGDSDRVMVVLGEHRGKVGRILERDPERGRALVQLGRDGAPRVLSLPYDNICHYLGGGDDD